MKEGAGQGLSEERADNLESLGAVPAYGFYQGGDTLGFGV